jgi:hypothetical protein
MPSIAIVDSGPLLATANPADPDHRSCREVLEDGALHLVVPSMCIAEVAYLLYRNCGARVEAAFLRGLEPQRRPDACSPGRLPLHRRRRHLPGTKMLHVAFVRSTRLRPRPHRSIDMVRRAAQARASRGGGGLHRGGPRRLLAARAAAGAAAAGQGHGLPPAHRRCRWPGTRCATRASRWRGRRRKPLHRRRRRRAGSSWIRAAAGRGRPRKGARCPAPRCVHDDLGSQPRRPRAQRKGDYAAGRARRPTWSSPSLLYDRGAWRRRWRTAAWSRSGMPAPSG